MPTPPDDRARHEATRYYGNVDANAPLVFGLIEMIESGGADRYLRRLGGAVRARLATPEYADFVASIPVGGGE